ncbi:hypothetical protein [Phenylobacterium sp.]|uniref:hypothetical protein n=1 Tax=Phenylobacterium sp. TaxID=1871053 RepID=UPI002F3F80E2
MPQAWSSQDNDDPGDIDSWMVWRNRQLSLGPEADAVARDLWNRGTWGGVDVQAPNSSDLTAIGLATLNGTGTYPSTAPDNEGDNDYGAPYPSAAAGSAGQGGTFDPPESGHSVQQGPSPAGIQTSDPVARPSSGAAGPWVSEFDVIGHRENQPSHPGILDGLNHNPVVRGLAGGAGYAIGVPAGVLRGGWHTLEGIGHGLNFVGSLFFPQGRAAAWNDAQTATHDALQYGRSVLTDPHRLARDAASAAKAANRSLNPFATPIPDTASGAFGHELGIGANDGETATTIAGLFTAPEVFGGIKAASTFEATREANVAKFMAQGFDEPTARYLSKPYEGQGDHAFISKSQNAILGYKTPLLKNVPIPDWIKDSPFNVSKPRGLSQGDFYEYHFGVDPQYYGGNLPDHLNGGRGWSGNRLGLERYDVPGRIWARIPSIWKDYDTGVALGNALRQVPQDSPETPQ